MQPSSGIGREKVYVPGQSSSSRNLQKCRESLIAPSGPKRQFSEDKICTRLLFAAADFHDARGLPALPDAGREAAGGARPRPVQEDRRRQVLNEHASIHSLMKGK